MTKLRRVADRAGRGAGSGVREKSRLRLYSASPARAVVFFVGAIVQLLKRRLSLAADQLVHSDGQSEAFPLLERLFYHVLSAWGAAFGIARSR